MTPDAPPGPSAPAPVTASQLVRAVRRDLYDLKKNWGWLLALGGLMIAAGVTAVGLSVLATILTVVAIGTFALIAAGAEVASAVWSRGWEGTVLHLLTAALYGVFGFLLVTKPALGAGVLTLLLAIVLLVNGVARIGYAVTVRFHHWGWAAASGLLSVLLGLMIWQDLPESALWVIGLFVGIDLLMTGWTWVALALALKNWPEPAAG
jgi:uncharacterized membrane protein HdeD (DUF308 family)